MNKFYNILLSQIIAQSKGEKETVSLSDNDIDEWKKAFNLKYNVDIDDAIEQNGDDQTLSIKNADVLNRLSEDIKEFLYEVLENQKDDIEPDSMGYLHVKTLASLLAFMPESETETKPPEIRTKMIYPERNKPLVWILTQTMDDMLKGCVSADNKPIYLDAMQRKLVTTLYNIIHNPEPGMEDNIVTLNYIIKRFYGKTGKDENPTNEEREIFHSMLTYFHTTPIVTPITDENGEPKLLHTYIVDLDYTEGISNGTRCAELFHIKSVIDLETIGSFPYYEAGLPPRMAHSLENIRIQQAVFDTRFSLENNKQIDFEKLCKSLKIRQNSKRRNEVIGKIQKMIRYYGMGEYVYPIEDNNGKVGRNKIVLLEIR